MRRGLAPRSQGATHLGAAMRVGFLIGVLAGLVIAVIRSGVLVRGWA